MKKNVIPISFAANTGLWFSPTNIVVARVLVSNQFLIVKYLSIFDFIGKLLIVFFGFLKNFSTLKNARN